MKQKSLLFPLPRFDILFAIIIGLLSLALYIRTLAPSLLWGDAAEFQTLSYTLGMTHPSGYATQIIFGKIFTLIPIRNIAYRVNLMSAFFGALAVAQVYLIVRILGGWRIAGLLASSALAINELFWRRTIFAESYAPAAGMLALVWLSVLLWRRTDRWVYLFLAGLTGGLSVGIHSTVVMTAASVLIYMTLTARKRSAWFGAAAGALLGLALTFAFFLFLDYNDPPSSIYNTTYRTNLAERGLTPEEFDTPPERLMTIFPARSFWTYYFTATPKETNRRIIEYVDSFPRWQTAGILLGALALFLVPKNGVWRWREGLYALVAFLLIWGFTVSVQFSVYKEFYVPVAVIVHVWLGIGASALLDGLEWPFKRWQVLGAERSALVPNLIGLVLVGAALWHAQANLRLAVKAGYTTFIKQEHIFPVFSPDKAVRDAQHVLRKVENNAIVFANWDRLYSYVYTAHILDRRTGISLHEAFVTDPPTLGQTTRAYIDANIDSRPIYFTVWLPELGTYYSVQRLNEDLYHITRKP